MDSCYCLEFIDEGKITMAQSGSKLMLGTGIESEPKTAFGFPCTESCWDLAVVVLIIHPTQSRGFPVLKHTQTYTLLWKENLDISDNLSYFWGWVSTVREKLCWSVCIVRRKLSDPQMHFQDLVEISCIFSLKKLFIPILMITDASESRENCPNALETAL